MGRPAALLLGTLTLELADGMLMNGVIVDRRWGTADLLGLGSSPGGVARRR